MKHMLVAATAMLLFSTGTARASDPPELKEGLWSVRSHTVDNPGNIVSEGTYAICRDHAYDAHVRTIAKGMKGCTMNSEDFQAGKYKSEMRCAVGGMVILSKGTTTFQGDTSTHSETRSTYTPAMGGITETSLVMDQKYTGICPAGSRPGDRIGTDGKVANPRKQ